MSNNENIDDKNINDRITILETKVSFLEKVLTKFIEDKKESDRISREKLMQLQFE